MVNKNGNTVTAYFRNFQFQQSLIHGQFAQVGNFPVVKLNSDLLTAFYGLTWNVEDEYTTLSANTEAGIVTEIFAGEIFFGAFFNIRSRHDFQQW